MRLARWAVPTLLFGLVAIPELAAAAVSVELWTNRGHDAVYQPGDAIQIRARVSEDANLIVYEIDAEGYVHLLFPAGPSGGRVLAGRTYVLPDDVSDQELVIQGPVGQGYVVAIASTLPFVDMPWYLRPQNAQAEDLGYLGAPPEAEDEGVTAEGRIVGDPFVAMERIRRAVVSNPSDADAFATAYTGYYVHEKVKYPRYLCNDCHRPGDWNWWAGFDPYYTHCSVFTFRVNWAWYWGPRYWFGYVPYYAYTYRYDCPPHYRRHYAGGLWHSSWDGRRTWKKNWGNALTRYKTDAPPGYRAPNKFDEGRPWRDRGGERPPGYLADRSKRNNGAPRNEPVAGVLEPTRPASGGRERRSGVPGYVPPAPTSEPVVGRNRRGAIDAPGVDEPTVGRTRRGSITPQPRPEPSVERPGRGSVDGPGPQEPEVGRGRRGDAGGSAEPRFDRRSRGGDGEPIHRSEPRAERPRNDAPRQNSASRDSRPSWRSGDSPGRGGGGREMRGGGGGGGGGRTARGAPSSGRPGRSKGD